mmetsp:Transcript_9081/g.1345  ORF Transcript_9081/g.1345 Transcript_9081/m.1345 type:complete len:80 (+) Transcript_9081:2271-2510(+)
MAFRSVNTYKFADDFSILLWVKPTALSEGGIFIKKAFDSYKRIMLKIDSSNEYSFSITESDNSITKASTVTPTGANEWD